MCEQSEINYMDGDVVWVKLGSCWWPGEVVGLDKLPPDVVSSFRKPPIAVVKFYQEDTFEYVKNINYIYKYNCSRKNEFINKGLCMYRSKHGLNMEKFPEDVIRAETAVGGDIEILTRDEFQEVKKESYKDLFGDPLKRTPGSSKKGRGQRGRSSEKVPTSITPRKFYKEKSDYKVHILVQPSKDKEPASQPATSPTPSTSRAGSEGTDNQDTPKADCTTPKASTPPTPLTSGCYSCPSCNFSTSRLNVLIMHNKTHSATYVPYTPSPVRKKPVAKTKSPNKTPKTPKTSRPRKERVEKPKKGGKKRTADEKGENKEAKKVKTDAEIKSSLLADWDDMEEESMDGECSHPSSLAELSRPRSPEVAATPHSPAAPVPAELPVPLPPPPERKPDNEKPESSSDSKYEFCEDEDWPEADVGRKIPRVKNPSARKEETKSLSIDDDIDVAKEVEALLNKTTVPELPSVPAPLKVEENFPEPTVAKSPDKKLDTTAEANKPEDKAPETKPTKTIFKTKTFFRSRHSRSQDAIGKYVAEQLNAAERMDMLDNELNGSEAVSSPEARESPPIEPVKVARLAPKIQLKKMKAEAAQKREQEKLASEALAESLDYMVNNAEVKLQSKPIQDVLYPTQEIKPIGKELPHRLLENEDIGEENDIPMLQNIGKMDIDSNREAIDIQYKTVDSIYPSNNTMVPDKFLDASPEKMPVEQVLEETVVAEQNITTSNEYEENNEYTSQKRSVEDITNVAEFVKSSELSPKKSPNCSVESSPKKPRLSPTQDVNQNTSPTLRHSELSPKKSLNSSDESPPLKLRLSPTFTQDVAESASPTFKQSEVSPKRSPNDLIESTPKKLRLSPTFALNNRVRSPTFTQDVIDSAPSTLSQDIAARESPTFTQRNSPTFTQDIPEANPDMSNNSLVKESTQKSSNYETQDNVLKSFKPVQPYMNESTASAVDALLSVSRETDRVPRAVSKDLPEDLFEDDNKDIGDDLHENTNEENNLIENIIVENNTMQVDAHSEINDINVISEQVVSNEDIDNEQLPDDVVPNKNTSSEIPLEAQNENVPTESDLANRSDLEIAETLINLPASAIQTNVAEHNDDEMQTYMENEQFVEEVIVNEKDDNDSFEAEYIETVISEDKSVPEDKPANDAALSPDKKNVKIRYETEQEKSENYNAAQSLVQMSECMDHTVSIGETKPVNTKELLSPTKIKQNNGLDKTVEQRVASLSEDNSRDASNIKSPKLETTTSKLLKILEEPSSKIPITKTFKKSTPLKQLVVSGKEKILNFDVAKASIKTKQPLPKQKIIIRRSGPGPTKNLVNLNSLSEVVSSPDQIILSRSNSGSQDGSTVQTFTIQASPDVHTDSKQIILQPKMRKIAKTPTKLQKIKPQESLVMQSTPTKTIIQPIPSKTIVSNTVDEAMFDINSMPVVLSDDILTPESIEKMPIVMSDGNIITPTPQPPPQNPPKLIKTKTIVENEKIVISPVSKPEVKTLLVNTTSENSKSNTPNILSKSSKLRGTKHMLVIDKTTGQQKIIMTKSTEPVEKAIKPAPAVIQQVQPTPKTEKFILLPTTSSPRPPGRTQKIVIDPQTGKAHVLMTKTQEQPLTVAENKPVSAKLIQSSSDNASTGTVMIITNAHGGTSRIVLTPEHEKILFPNKQPPNISQLKAITQRISPNRSIAPKTLVSSTPPAKSQPKIVPKQKGAIITSKGQLIVGGRVTSSTPNIAPMPEIRPTLKNVTKRLMTTETKKIVQTIQKPASEPLIILQQKSGAIMQLTAAQFEHLQRTGQIVQKAPAPENKIVMQKSITITPKEPLIQTVTKQRVRKTAAASPTPAKKVKHEIAQPPPPAVMPAPAPVTPAPVPPLTAISHSAPTVTLPQIIPSVASTVSVSSTPSYPDVLENFEELLPSTAIARQVERQVEPPVEIPQPPPEPELVITPAETVAEPPPGQIADGQLLAVPGENFGGPAGSFYLCVEENGTFTPIDNRPLVLENNQLVPMALEPAPVFTPQPERRDILEAALANSDVFHSESPSNEAPDFRDLNANVSVHCRVSETSTTLNQPIMTPVEVPTKAAEPTTVPSNLEDGLAVIGVTPHTVPTSLELPITVTDPRIAPKTTDPLSSSGYAASLLSPSEMSFGVEESTPTMGPMSMPLLTDEEPVGNLGKSMPILTDEVEARTVSSVESPSSPASTEPDDAAAWSGARRLLTPGSDSSETSTEIPIQPAIQLSVADLARPS